MRGDIHSYGVRAVLKLMLALSSLVPASIAAQESATTFSFSFSRGLNLRDDPAVLGLSRESSVYAVGNSYNFDYWPDGTARKRKGISEDTCSLGTSSKPVNLLVYDPTPYLAGVGLTFAVADTFWYQRFNQDGFWANSGDWLSLTIGHVPPQLKLNPTAFLSSVYFNGRLIIGGEIADAVTLYGKMSSSNKELWPVRSFLCPELHSPPTATVSTGGTLADSTTYYYVYTFSSPYSSASSDQEESYSSLPCSVTVVFASGDCTITVGNIKRFPEYAYTTSTYDTMYTVGSRNIYRSTNGADYYWLTTVLDPSASTVVDSGQYYPDQTKIAPDPLNLHSGFRFATEYSDFLWTTGTAYERPAEIITTSSLAAAVADTLLSVSPFSQTRGRTVKYFVPANWSVTNYGTTRTLVTIPGAELLSAGVTAGDQFCSKGGESPILTLVSDSTFVVEYYNYSATDKATEATIGDNFFKIDDEIIGLVYRTTTQWRIKRYRCGTMLAAHSSGTQLYRYLDRRARDYLYVSERWNPQRYIPVDPDGESWGNYDKPADVSPGQDGDITGLVGGDVLRVYKEQGIYVVSGYSPSTFTLSRQIFGIGNVSPRALAEYRGSSLILDRVGVYAHNGNQLTKLSNTLGTAIGDSAASGYYEESAGTVHNDKYYLSTVKTAATKDSKVWVYDLSRDLWTVYHGWYPHVWGQWPQASDKTYSLYWGDWRKGNVYKVDPTRTADVSIAGADSAITAELVTPRFGTIGKTHTWKYASLTFDTNDTLTVQVTVGYIDNSGVSVSRTKTILSLSPANAADVTISGIPRTWRTAINEVGETLQLTITSKGTGRCTVYPSAIYAVPREER